MLFELKENYRERIPVFKIGVKVKHEAGDFTPDEEFISTMVSSFTEFHKDKSYRPPILRGHNDEEGITYGKVISLERDGDLLIANVEWADGMKELREGGKISNFSPSFHNEFQDPHSDKVYKYLFRELSFVSLPHLKNLPSTEVNHYSLKGSVPEETVICPEPFTLEEAQPMAQEEEKKKELEEEEKDPMQAFEARLSELEERFKKEFSEDEEDEVKENEEENEEDDDKDPEFEEDDEDDEDEPVENSEDTSGQPQTDLEQENADLKAKVKEYELKELRLSLSEHITDLDDDTFKDLVELKETSESLYNKTVTKLSETSFSETSFSETNKETPETNVKGSTGFAEKGTKVYTKDEAVKLAEEKGIYGHKRLDFLEDLGVFQ